MPNALHGHTALVTGASAGIGRETAIALVDEGAAVAVAARREDRLHKLADEIEDEHGGTTLVLPTDVTDYDAVVEMVDDTLNEFGSLEIVVSNAGIIYPGLADLSVEEYRDMMAVNTDGMFYTTKVTLPHLQASEGNLIFVGSYAGNYPIPGAPVYSASKWWTRGFALSVAGEAGGDGVGVTVVNPSTVRSEFGSEYREPNREKFPAGEVTESADVADAIVYAATREPPNTVSELDLYDRKKFSKF
jgi:NADP-dependent 3-hydroxy acid dehydrogenase YdfG